MRKSLSTFLALSFTVPVLALALDYTDQSVNYEDAPFGIAESAAISVLTNAEVVQGYPDGTFHPERTLNRAEFVKIAWLSIFDEPSGEPAFNCFPDVRTNDWFNPYVCASAELGVVQGYPNGLFQPEKPVNYVEAIKILAELYDYELPAPPENERWAWYRPYYLAAEEHKVLLAVNIELDDPLTRGQMSRLTAAFMAESEGELEMYRRAERGQSTSVSSSSSSSQSSAGSSVSSSSSSKSSVSSSSSASSLSVSLTSHFLVTGELSAPIASANFFSTLEPMILRAAEVVLEDEVPSISAMYLIDVNGNRVGQLSLDNFDSTDRTWKGSFTTSDFKIPQNVETNLAVQVLLKERGNAGGQSDDLVQVDEFTITVLGEYTNSTYDSQPRETIVYPQHQTSYGRITRVINTLPPHDGFILGTNQLIGSFLFEGKSVTGATLRVEHLTFDVSKQTGVAISSWVLKTPGGGDSHSCSATSTTVTCLNIPEVVGTLNNGSRTLQLFGDVAMDQGTPDPFLQVSLNDPGAIGETGAVQWTDGTGHFVWVELDQPVVRGTRWE